MSPDLPTAQLLAEVRELRRRVAELEAEGRRRAAEDLLAGDQRYHVLAQHISDVIVTLDLQLRANYVTPSVERLLGYSTGEVFGMRLRDILTRESYRVGAALLAEELAREGQAKADPHRSRTVDLELRRKDGSTVWAEVKVSFVRDADGRARGMVAVVRDISAWREAQQALRRSEERLRQIIDLVPHFVFAKDIDGRFLLVNQAVAEVYGTTVEELTGKTDADFAQSDEEVRHFRADDLEVIQSGRPKLIREERITDSTGRTRHLQTVKIPFTTAGTGTPAVLGVATDITERKQAEEKLEEREEQLRQVQKMRAIGQLAGGLAHDFNNLLTVVLGNVQPLLDALAPGERWRAEAEQILYAAERAAALTRQLLAFSRRQLLTPAVLDVNQVVTETEQMLRRLIGERIELETQLDPDLGRVRADRSQIEQVLINLTVNARDAMPHGGRLRFETANEEVGAERAATTLGVAPGAYVRLSAADTGCGMDAETRARAFEPFFTTKEQGTGLGLATVYGIVEGGGGGALLVSEPGRGTRVDIYLPRVEAEVARAPAVEPAGAPRGSETVLLVEDEPAIRSLLRNVLQSFGYTVLEAADGEAALAVGAEHRGGIDLLLTDVVMPRTSGRQLAEELTAADPRPRVLFMSGYPEEILEHGEALEPGAQFIAKPFTPLELIRKVRAVLDGS